MRERKWVLALTGLLACGLIAAGCGDDNEDTTTTSGDTSTTQSSESGSTPDDVYQACIDAIEGTPAESAGKTACEQTRNAFEQCSEQANNAPEGTARDTAIQACQKAADTATAALKSGG
jgi:hypothetical protein